jgi:hypothetical protein
MTRALRNISASVEKRLLNLSRQSGEDFQYVLMRYGLERLMYRLSRSGYSKEFVVKGAMLLRVWTGEQYRPTKDLDLLAIPEKSPEELDQTFRDVCTLTVEDDGLVFLTGTIRVRQIREDNVYGGIRVTLESRLGLSIEFVSDAGKLSQWDAFVRRSRLDTKEINLETVVKVIAGFMIPPSISAAEGKAFLLRWTPGGLWQVQ